MLERIVGLFRNIVSIFVELSFNRKLAFGGIVAAVFISIFITVSVPATPEKVYLFKKPISLSDLAKITTELERLNISHTVVDDKYVVVEDKATGTRARMELAQKKLLPQDIKGWELFDTESWTTTKFDRDVKLRRAIEGEIRKHLEALRWIEHSEVSISVPEKSLYTDRKNDVQAAVSITPAEGYRDYLLDKSIIKGIENILSTGIDGLSPDNIVITDHTGNQINLFVGEDFEDQVKQAVEQNKVRDVEIKKIVRRIQDSLKGVLAEDRYRVAVDIELNFDKQTVSQKEILPVVIKERTPNLPYDDSVVRDNVRVSRKKLSENFQGVGFVPEGPAGQEPNLPPGYKESLEGKNIYNKNEEIDNFANGEKVIQQTNDAYEIERKSVSVMVDGLWHKEYDEDGKLVIEKKSIKRIYKPLAEEELNNLEQVVQASINFSPERKDVVVVRNIPFDRQSQFEAEDAAYFRAQGIRFFSMVGILSIVGVLIAFFVIRSAVFYWKRYKAAKEEEENLIRQLHREEALSDLDKVVVKDYEVSDEEKEFKKMQEEINLLVDKNPSDIGRLIATVISES